MISNSTIIYIYAAFVFIGGAIGFANAGSFASLAMGTLFGLSLAFCGKMMGHNKGWAYRLALGLTALLCAFFGYRFFLTEKFMPAGLMTILSLLTISALLSLRFGLKKLLKETS